MSKFAVESDSVPAAQRVRSRPLVRQLRLLLLASLGGLLVACGGPSEPGPQPLTDSDYILRGSAIMPAGQFDDRTQVWMAEATQINESGTVSTEWYDSFAIGADGAVELEFDAREMQTKLDPREVLRYLSGNVGLPSTLSDPAAVVNFLPHGFVFQWDEGSDTNNLFSHTLTTGVLDGSTVRVARPYFTERAFTLTATRTAVGSVSYAADIQAEPGWNLVHLRHDGDRDFTYVSRPIDDQLAYGTTPQSYFAGSAQDDAVPSVAAFTERSVAEPQPTWLTSASSSVAGAASFVYLPRWLGFDTANRVLAPMAEAFPGVFTTAGVTVEPPETRGAVAAFFGYDADATGVEGWDSDTSAALGRLGFISSAGLTLWHIYADRTSTLYIDVPYAGTGRLWGTSLGVTLQHGWNMVEVRPDGPGEYVLIRAYTAPSRWSLRPN